MPKNTALKLQKWPWSDPFLDVQRRSGLTPQQMLETLNCGIGFVFILDPQDVAVVVELSKNQGWASWILGPIVKDLGEAKVLI